MTLILIFNSNAHSFFHKRKEIKMKQTKIKFHGFKSLLVLIFLFTLSTSIYAKNDDCWVDLYDDTQYEGNHFRQQGPAKLKSLTKLNGENWDQKIESLIVGPKATLTLFENKNFKLTLKEMINHPVLMKSLGITKQDILEDSELIFQSNVKVHGFGEFNFYHKIRSLKIECK